MNLPPSGRPFPSWLLAAVTADVLILDQLTKWLVEKNLALHAVKPMLPFFSLVHVHNTGASFGMFQDSNRAFAGLTILILIVLALMHRRLTAEGRLTALGLALLWGGALGNLIDRLRVGAVVDFLDFFWGHRHWPAFNVADSAITIGVGLMIIQSFRHDRNQTPPR